MDNNVFENLYQEELYVLPKRTLIVLDRQWHELTDEQTALLTRILGSVRLTPASVQFFTTANVAIEQLVGFNPERIISFGPVIVGVIGLYQYTDVAGVPVICADSIDRLDDPRKKRLWGALRQMFGIS